MTASDRVKRDVLNAVRDVPAGRVTTYGAIADAVDAGPRQVASILSHDPEAASVPWHRVVASKGKLSIPDAKTLALQTNRLEDEGIAVANGRVLKFSATFYAP